MARGKGTLCWLASREYDGRCHFRSDYMRSLMQKGKSMYRKDLFSHYGCVNAIEFSSDGEWLSSGGDDRRVLLWNVQRTVALDAKPYIMKGEHNSNIFCLGFDNVHTKVFSAGNDEQVVIHNIENGETLDVFLHEEAVYGLSVDPLNSNVFASACDNGQVLIWDTRQSGDRNPFILAQSSSAFHAVVYNPVEPRLLATANAREGVSLWDIRKPRINLLSYGGCFSAQSSMSVRFSRNGMKLLALRRRLPPVLYNISSPCPVVEFDHPGYYNSCTMKSCTFAGDDDQYIMSGSDDFKLYMWQIPPDCEDKKGLWINTAHMVLKGHRSIVNQVRYSPASGFVASSGVEKVVKLWSLFPFPNCEDGKPSLKKEARVALSMEQPDRNPQDPRHVYSHEEYINLVLESGQFMTHDYSHKSMHEDPRMMAFFDSLVQRDIEGWTSDSSDSSLGRADCADKESTCVEVQSLASSSTTPLGSDSESSSSSTELSLQVQDKNLAPQTLSYITTLTNRVEANLSSLKQENSHAPQEGDSGESNNANRISQLIARRRHEQLLRTARSTVKLTQKRLKRTKNGGTFVNGNELLEVEEKTLDGVRKILDSVLLRQTQNQKEWDTRRRLRRRRERLCQNLSDSSDQSSGEVGVTDSSLTLNSSTELVDNSSRVEDDHLVSQNGEEGVSHLTDSDSNKTPETNSNTNNNEKHENKGVTLSNVISKSVPEEKVPNGSSEDVACTSRFRPINSKHSKRNYRMKNHQKDDDDD